MHSGGRLRRRGFAFQARLSAAALVVLIVGAAAAIVFTESELHDAAVAADRAHEGQLVVVAFGQTLHQTDADLARYALTGDPAMLSTFNSDEAAYESTRSTVEKSAEQATIAPAVERLLNAADRWHDWMRGAVARSTVGLPVDFREADSLQAQFDTAEVVASARSQQASLAAASAIDTLSARVATVTVAAATVGLAGLAGLLALLFTSTLRPIARLSAAAAELAHGHTVAIESGGGSAELRELGTALETWRAGTQVRLRMAETIAAIGDPFSLDRVLAKSADALGEVLGARHVAYTLVAEDGRRTLAAIFREGALELIPEAANPEGSPSRQVSASGQPLTADLRSSRWPVRVREYAAAEGLGPALLVPLRSTGRSLGVVSLTRSAGEPMFTAADIDTAQLVIPNVAAAVHVAQLLGELRAANQHKSEFLAHMSHELRTPLNSVLGFAQLLSDSRMGELSERQGRYVDHILSSGSHLLSLINDALDLSKVEAGQLALDLETVAVWRVLASCVAKVRPAADAKGIQLSCAASHHLAVLADRRRLVQIVLNLLSNAVKFTGDGGRIDVRARPAGGALIITVHDTGIGIAAEDHERVFDAFVQVGEGRTRDQDGTGLGLSLSRALAEQMGGTLTVESEIARGSRFHLRLPLSRGVAAAEELAATR